MMKIKRYIFLVAALLLMGQGTSAWSGSGNSASDPILIANANDWNTLATNVASGTNYSGKYFKLTADITVTTIVGSYSGTKTFNGTFDGGGHTLTFNYTATAEDTAPFAYLKNATIQNLRVAGTINTGYKFAAGLCVYSSGSTNIEACQISVTINSTLSNDGTYGGLVSDHLDGTLNINNCLFDGQLLGTGTFGCGGFVGWDKTTTNITNSLFAPTAVSVQGPTFSRTKYSNTLSLTNCYYTDSSIIGNTYGYATQGSDASGMTAAALVTALNNGGTNWCNNGGNATPILIFDYIGNQSNWNAFTSGINAGISYSGKTVKMSADFTATTMATSTFSGTFDGGGHTLTFNYTATGNNAAPFAYITGATIKNLRVAGTINSGYKFAAGIVAISNGGTITNCQSSVTINSSKSGDGTHGGLVADSYTGTLNINNCLFDGKLLGENTESCGGIVGYHKQGTLNITNTLFAPTEVTLKAGTIFARNGATSLTNCYYKSTWSAATVQGTNANSMTAEALVAALNNGNKNWCVYRGNAIPVMVNLVINNKTEWDNFSSHAGNYENKYVQLNADISNITAMTSGTFQGIFDGNGHTLTVNLTNSGGNVAPFYYLNGGTIMNLTVSGDVTTAGSFNAGLVARTHGGINYIQNCIIHTNVKVGDYGGGVVGHADDASSLTISDCIYDGTITHTGDYAGGFIGWYNWDNHTLDLTMTNCLCKGTYNGNGTFHPIGVKKSGYSIDTSKCHDCYYTTNPHKNPGSDRYVYAGTKCYSIIAGTDVTISGLGTATSTYEHNVITVYSHGIKYNLNSTDYYYAGGDEVVSLNLAHGSKTGYTFSNYEVSGGGSLSNLTATSATLTMTAADQTIDAQWTENVATLNETANALDELTAMSGKQTKVTFTRSGLTANSYSTMCLPFDFTAPSGCTFYAFTGVEWSTTNDQWEATITEQASATTLSAHTPYIFKCTGTSATFTNNAVIAASSYDNALVEVGATSGTDQAWKFKGTYTPLSWASADPTEPTYGFSTYVSNETIAAGTFVRFVKGASLAPFRARLIYSGTDTHLNAPRRAGANELPVIIIVRIIGINGETTSIGTLDTRTGEVTTDGWYTLGGMKLKGQPNQQGIYIHNGRKEVIR